MRDEWVTVLVFLGHTDINSDKRPITIVLHIPGIVGCCGVELIGRGSGFLLGTKATKVGRLQRWRGLTQMSRGLGRGRDGSGVELI